MPVQTASLEVLEKAEIPAGQARAIVQAIEIEITGANHTLATKHDLLTSHQGLKLEMSELRLEMSELRQELKREMSDLRHGLELKIDNVRGDLRAEMHALAASNLRQMYGAMLGQLAVLLGLAYFFVTHLAH